MPTYLARALENILAGESDFVTTVGDIFEMVLLVW
jgi:adenosine/AMP kinase